MPLTAATCPRTGGFAGAPSAVDVHARVTPNCVGQINTVAGALPLLGSVLTDTNGTPAGPFYQGTMTAPNGWTYTYTRTGAGTFQLVGASPTDLPTSNIQYP